VSLGYGRTPILRDMTFAVYAGDFPAFAGSVFLGGDDIFRARGERGLPAE